MRSPCISFSERGLHGNTAWNQELYLEVVRDTEEDFRETSRQLEDRLGAKDYGFYLPSSGSWSRDFSQAMVASYSKSKDIDIAQKLADHLKSLLSEVGPQGRVLYIAHSAGAIMTYLAAKYHLTSEKKRRIDAITFGGGRSIARKYFPGRTVNHYL